jgi:hypothetical protein
MVRFFFQFVVIVAMHPMWNELNTIVSTLCAVTATDGTTTKRRRNQEPTEINPDPHPLPRDSLRMSLSHKCPISLALLGLCL